MLAVVCAVSRRFPLDFGKVEVEVVDVAILAALVFLGPIWALLVAAPAVFYREPLRTLYSAATHVLILLAAGYVFGVFAEPLLWSARFDSSLVYAAVAAGAAYCGLDAAINCALLRMKYATPFGELLRTAVVTPIPSDVASVLTALGASYAMVAFGQAAALILFCGAGGALCSLYLVRERQQKVDALSAEVEVLREENSAVVSSPLVFADRLVADLGIKDGYTARHAHASALYASDLAKEIGLDATRADRLRVAALLQDVGLVSVPDEVLLTPPRKLNSVGRMHLEQHPVRGERVLSGVPGFGEAAKWVRWHHEREDGTGYPDRLRGEWIPLEAKILATASHYASLVLGDPHRPGLSPGEARRELVGLTGGGLDQVVVRTFLRVLDAEDARYAVAADGRFAPSVGTSSSGWDNRSGGYPAEPRSPKAAEA